MGSITFYFDKSALATFIHINKFHLQFSTNF